MNEGNPGAPRQEDGSSSEHAEELSVFDKLSDHVGRMLADNYSHVLTLGTHYTPELVLAETDEALDLLKLSLFLGSNQPGYSPTVSAYRILRSKNVRTHSEELEAKQLDMVQVKRDDLIRMDRPNTVEAAKSDLVRLELAVSQFADMADSLPDTAARKLGFSETYIRSRAEPAQ